MAGEGVVAVGVGGEIARFAVSTIIGWWGYLGRGRYRAAARVTVTADWGGSNNPRARLCGATGCGAWPTGPSWV